MYSIIELNRLYLASLMTETWFLCEVYFTNVMSNFLIIKSKMIHYQNKSFILVNLISLEKYRCIFIDGKDFLFAHFESDDSEAWIIRLKVKTCFIRNMEFLTLWSYFEVQMIFLLVSGIHFFFFLCINELIKWTSDTFHLIVSYSFNSFLISCLDQILKNSSYI